jgi:DNA-binding ferritin-like protein
MQEFKPLNDIVLSNQISVFLAGSIEMGKAELWQDKVAKALKDYNNLVLFNPRRDDWDSSWVNDPAEGTQFNQQVSWELSHIIASDMVIFYLDPNTQSPISLMELGLCVGMSKNCIVCCSDKFWKYGNVVMTCNLKGVPVVSTLDELISELKTFIENKQNGEQMEEQITTIDSLVQQLKVIQATAFSYYLKAHNYHWNVTGKTFSQDHEFLNDIYTDMWESIDSIAEHIRTLNQYAPGSLKRFSELTKIEDEFNIPTVAVMYTRLHDANLKLIAEYNLARNMAESANKMGLVNFIEGELDRLETLGWKLRSQVA